MRGNRLNRATRRILLGAIVLVGSFVPQFCHAETMQDRVFLAQAIQEAAEGKPASAAGMGDVLTTGKVKAREWRFLYNLSETFDNNIYTTRKKTIADWITDASPQLKGTLQDSRKVLSLSAASNIKYYAKNGHQSDWKGFRVTGETLFFRNSKIKWRTRDTFSRQTTLGNNSYTKKDIYLTNQLGTGLQYDISPKSSLLVDYTNSSTRYSGLDNLQNNYMQHVATPTFMWKYSKRTTFRTGYSFGLIRYPKNPTSNSTYHQPMLGITSQFTPKSSLDLNLGYQYRINSSSLIKNQGSMVGSGGYNYNWTPKTALRIFAGRSINQTTTEGQSSMTNTFGGLGISHLLTPKLATTLSSALGMTSYPQKESDADGEELDQNTTTWGTQVMVGYSLNPMLYIALRYTFTQCFAKMKENRYQDNKVSLSLNGVF